MKVKKKNRSLIALLLFVFISVAYLGFSGQIRVVGSDNSNEFENLANYYDKISTSYPKFEDLPQSSKSVIFFKASWCSMCSLISTSLKEEAIQYPYIHFYELDVDSYRNLVNEAGVVNIPSLVFLNDGIIQKKEDVNIDTLKKEIQIFSRE